MTKATTQRINSVFTSLIRSIEKQKDHFMVKPFTDLDQILNLLVENNIISGFTYLEKERQICYKVYITYNSSKKHWINSIDYYSTPGNRRFIRVTNLKKAKEWNQLNRLGLIRTRLGFLTLKTCIKYQIGGELIILIK